MPGRDRRRDIGILLAVLVLLIFVGEIIALATGQLVLASVFGGLLIGGWFVLRSWQRRRGG